MKRSSWRTLRPHQKHANTFGSAEWRTRLSISEFIYFSHGSIGFFFVVQIYRWEPWRRLLWQCFGIFESHLMGVVYRPDNEGGGETPLTFSEWHKPASASAFYVRYGLSWARVMRVSLSAQEGRLESKQGAALLRSATGDVTSPVVKGGIWGGVKMKMGWKHRNVGWPYVMVWLYFIIACSKTMQ